MSRKFFKPGCEVVDGLRVSGMLVGRRSSDGTSGTVSDETTGQGYPAHWVVNLDERGGGHWEIGEQPGPDNGE
tara:strand:- start:585 stop:803 length:219 start_codon:yes stop_codon:yes gene_type:complete